MATLRFVVVTALATVLVGGMMTRATHAAEGEATFGTQWWDQTERDAKYQEFREVPRGGFLESFLLREWSGRTQFAIWGANAIRADQAYRATLNNGARWRIDFGYQQIPHTFSHTARWGWLQSDGSFTLPDSLQARNQALPGSYTQRMTDFLRTAPVIPLNVGTNITRGRAIVRPTRGWQVEARSTARTRSGRKAYGFSYGFNTALENPEPINQTMVDADLIAGYQKDRVKARASVGLSTFDNDIGVLRVDNPKRITDQAAGDGPAVGQMDLYPNNRVVRGSLTFGYLPAPRTAFAATISLARGEQDDAFLPFTINSALPQNNPDSLPARHLDGKSLQLNGDARLTTQLAAGLNGVARFNYADFDNQTEELNFIGQTPYESGWQRYIQLNNHILSNTHWVGGFDLDYSLTPKVKLGGLAEYRVRERTEREVEKDNETVFGGRVWLWPADGLSLMGDYTRGDRQQDAFHVEEYYGLTTRTAIGSTPSLFDSVGILEQPGLRRYDVAERIQDHAKANLSYLFGERLELSASYDYLRNDFAGDTLLGLQEEKLRGVSTAATIHVNPQLDLTGGYGFNRVTTDQRSRSSGAVMSFNPDSNWSAKIDEEEVFVSAGINWQAQSKLGFSADYNFSRNLTDYDLGNGLNNAADLPSTFYRRHVLEVESRWQWLENTSLIGRYGWEQYDVDDWATNDVPLIFPVTGTANAIFLGDSSTPYIAHRVALLVNHKF